jgi:hypothetical protein
MNTEELIKQVSEEFDKELKILTNDISKEVSQMESDSEVLQENHTLFKIKNGNYTYNFEWRKVIFDLPIPNFTMKQQKWSFDIPEVTMNMKEICFDLPKTRMVDKKIGEKPEITCDWKIKWVLGVKTKFWDCTKIMTPIIISVPEITMETKCIATKIPTITIKTQEIIIDIPEVTVQNKRIIFNSLVISSIDYTESEDSIENSNEKINQSQQKINNLTIAFEEKMKFLQKDLVIEKFEEAEKMIYQSIQPQKKNLENSIEECKNTVSDLKNNGATEQLRIEESNLNKLINDLKLLIAPYEQALIELNNQREITLKNYS